MAIILEVRMAVLQCVDYPKSFDKDTPMSVQLKAERLKLFPQNKSAIYIDTPDDPFLKKALDFLNISFSQIYLVKGNKYSGTNYDLFAIVYYLRSRKICTLSFIQKYIFTERSIYNYKRHVPNFINKRKYIDLFNYLDSLS